MPVPTPQPAYGRELSRVAGGTLTEVSFGFLEESGDTARDHGPVVASDEVVLHCAGCTPSS